MSISLVEKEIARFLSSPEPEVICVRGKWGVGKTYSWNTFLHTAKDRDAIAPKSYAYVSLFGLDSLDQLKYAVFENSVATKDIGIEPSVETFKENALAVANRLGKKSLWILDKLPRAKNYASALQSLSFLSVRNMIVCVDDLERKGKNLPIKDVMGLISHLREQKKCKVALILNDDALHDDDKTDFERYNEKVIDVSVQFEPDATDCVRIAVTGEGQALDWLRGAVVALNISNIRVIKKIERLVLRVAPLVEELNPQVLKQAVQTLTLLGWSVYSKEEAPKIDFLLRKRGKHFYGLSNNEEIPEVEKTWNSLLDDYGFARADEFDLELLNGIKQGFFDEAALTDRASDLHGSFQAAEAGNSLEAAWKVYHGSFDDNEDEVVTAICDATRSNVQYVTPINLNGTVSLLKALGRQKEASDILDFYIEQRGENRGLFDLSNYPFDDDITDPDVRAAFDETYTSVQDDRPPLDVLMRIANERGWGREDISLLSNLSAEEFYTLFKEGSGSDLPRAIRASLQFGRIVNADDAMKQISSRAEEALMRIGRESNLNKRRVEKIYRVKTAD